MLTNTEIQKDESNILLKSELKIKFTNWVDGKLKYTVFAVTRYNGQVGNHVFCP
jgi:hypothetical protein